MNLIAVPIDPGPLWGPLLYGLAVLGVLVPWLVIANHWRRRHPGDKRARALGERPADWTARLTKRQVNWAFKEMTAGDLPCVYPTPCDCPGCVALGRDVPMVQKGAR